ncbi:protein of unknown function [Methanoculleus bourgensis]|uniref:Uncharacterized protein n=1 Tax=Methanoculleus bourgensis TaxID=83986 RepID=A0A0X3BLP4_9EURY|nr:protein of unknown function [Methanoculleus bourgensis]
MSNGKEGHGRYTNAGRERKGNPY